MKKHLFLLSFFCLFFSSQAQESSGAVLAVCCGLPITGCIAANNMKIATLMCPNCSAAGFCALCAAQAACTAVLIKNKQPGRQS